MQFFRDTHIDFMRYRRFWIGVSALVLIGTWVLVLVPVAISLLYRRRTQPLRPMDRYYLAFCNRMAGLNIERRAGETPGQFADRVCLAVPGLTAQVRHITRLYDELAYVGSTGDAAARDRLLRRLSVAVRTFRPRRAR